MIFIKLDLLELVVFAQELLLMERALPWKTNEKKYTADSVFTITRLGNRRTERTPVETRRLALISFSIRSSIQVELIQPIYGPMIYEAFIQKHGEGLHHFKERISQDDIDEVLKEYREKGIEVTQTGQFKEDFHYYLNTEPKLDFVLELGNCPLLNLPKDEFPIYPPEKD